MQREDLDTAVDIEESSLRDVLYVLFRHKWKIALVFLLIAGGTLLHTLRTPDWFQSEARLLIKLGRNLSADPAVIGPIVNMTQNRRDEVNSELEILRSRSLIEAVVDKAGPETILGKDRNGSSPGLLARTAGKLIGRREGLSVRARAVEFVGRNLEFTVPKESNIIEARMRALSPETAQGVLAALLDGYLERHIEVYRSQATPEFFRKETERLHTELTKAEDALTKFQNESHIAVYDQQKLLLVNRIDALNVSIGEAAAKIAASKTKIDYLQKAIGERPAKVEISRTEGFGNSVADDYRKRLSALEVEEKRLAGLYPAGDRRLAVIRTQIDELERALKGEKSTTAQVTTGLDTTRQQMELDLKAEQTGLVANEALLEQLRREAVDKTAEIERLNAHQATLNRLERNVKIREKEYLEYSDNYQRSQISMALDNSKVSNVSIVQAATRPEAPLGLNKTQKLAMGALLGLFLSVAFAFFADFLQSSLHTSEDVRKRLDLPVLASVSAEEFRSCT